MEITRATEIFINLADNLALDEQNFVPFARVVEGMDVVDRIRVVPTGAKPPFAADVPVTPVLVESAKLLED